MLSDLIEGGASTGLSVIQKVVAFWSTAKSDNLADYTASTRVEPICLVDSNCTFNDMLPEVMQSLLSMFSGYYLQAMNISMNVGKISVMRELDRLNPNRNPLNTGLDTASTWLMSQESYQHKLPIAFEALHIGKSAIPPKFTNITNNNTDNSVHNDSNHHNKVTNNTTNIAPKPNETSAISSKENLLSVKEMSNLSVGKLLAVDVSDGAHKATVTVAVRLMVSDIQSQDLVSVMAAGNQDTGVVERYHAWKSGRLDFIRDILLCQDLISEHRKNLIKDKTGFYSEILNRRRKNQLSTILSGNPSVATASNILVVSSDTIRELEGQTGVSFDHFNDREKLLKETGIMIVAVLDGKWDRVTFYTKGIHATTELGLRDLKSSNKNSGPDITEILRMYASGSSPSL